MQSDLNPKILTEPRLAEGMIFLFKNASFSFRKTCCRTFREDAKTGDGRRPDYVTFSTIDKDAERRDLTINALYYDMEAKCILDFFGGIKDIQSNTVRFVGDVRDRIHEDKLRILRFIRFHCRMNKSEDIHHDTREVIGKTLLRPEVSDERIRDEFLKGLSSAQCVHSYVRLLHDLNLLVQVFPDLNIAYRLEHGDQDYVPESIIAQILRYNNPRALTNSLFKTLKETLLHLRYTAQEVTNIVFLLDIRTWRQEKDFVAFKQAYKRTSLDKGTIMRHASLAYNSLAKRMLEAPYPTVRGDEVMQETGLEGKSLGEEMLRRELENFRLFLQAT